MSFTRMLLIAVGILFIWICQPVDAQSGELPEGVAEAVEDDLADESAVLDQQEEDFSEDDFVDDELLEEDFSEDDFVDDEFSEEDLAEEELIEFVDEFLDFIEFDEEFFDEEFFDPDEGTYDDWLESDDLIDWDADGEFDEEDFELLAWLYDESSSDVDGDGFFDEEDFFFAQWLDGVEVEDYNGDGFLDEDDYILFNEFSGIFENEIYFAFIEPGYNRALVEWVTAEPGVLDSVYYRPVGYSVWQTATHSGDIDALEYEELFEHLVTLTDLEPDTEYEIQLRSISVDGFATEVLEDEFRTRAAADLRPAVIMDLDYETDLQEVFIFWVTNRPTDARFVVRKAADGTIVTADTLDREGDFVHDIEITGLEAGTEYDIVVASVPVGLEGLGAPEDLEDSETFSVFTRSGQLPVQMIFPPFDIVTPNSAVVSAEFNQSVRLRVDYARTDNFRANVANNTANTRIYKDTVSTGKLLRSHLVNLNKLKANTEYRYRIVAFAANGDSFSTDPRGTNQWSYDWQFTTSTASDTLAPTIIEGPEVVARDKIAVLEWVTDVETTGKVYFGTQSGTYGTADEFAFSDLAADGSPNFSFGHIVTLAGLDPGTNYQFRIESVAANGKKAVFTPSVAAAKRSRAEQPPGGAGSFTTDSEADTQRPVILTGPRVTAKTHNSAVLEWTTDEPANSQARFGASELSESVRSGANSSQHKLVLSNLAAGTTYRYNVASTDAVGNGPAESAESVFTTDAEADLVAPLIKTTPFVAYKNDRSATIRWETDEVATGRIEFGSTDSVKTVRKLAATGIAHEVALTNLQPNTRYYYRASSTDLSNNGPTTTAVDSFTTDASADLTSPILSGVLAVAADSSALVRWQSDELADSFVEFGYDSLLLGSRVGDAKDVTSHEVALTNLRPATKYYFKTGSVDRANNPPAESAVASFVTLSSADTSPPAAPMRLRAKPGSQQIVLSWAANSEIDLAGYNVYRRLVGGDFSALATRVEDTTYVDLGLRNGTDYEYRLTAIDRAPTPNESTSVDTVRSQPTASAAPSAPTPQRAQGRLRSPTLIFRDAASSQVGATLTYTVQVSTDSLFSSVAASQSGIVQGASVDEAGHTAWTVDRELADSTTFYWRVRAVEGDSRGPYSATRSFITQRRATEVSLPGDFNGDKTVGFDDFFLFVDNFGKKAEGAAAKFDLDKNGNVDFNDFFTFSDNFGKSVSSKRWASITMPHPHAFFALDARTDADADRGGVWVRLWAGGVDRMKAFGAVLRYDPRLLAFERLNSGAGYWLESDGREAPLLRVLTDEPGELVFGHGITNGDELSGHGVLAELRFRLLGSANQAKFELVAAFVHREGDEGLRIDRLGHAGILPPDYALGANFPNPFNPSTSINYALPRAGATRLTIYDVLGRKVRTLVDDNEHRAGFYTAVWDGRDEHSRVVASGVYFYLLEAGTLRQSRKMVLVQ